MEESKTEGDVDWLGGIVKKLVSAGLGLIPYVGSLLALGEDVVAEYLENPEEWGAKNEMKLGTEATNEAIQASKVILKFYKNGKVPGIRFKSHLEGSDQKPIYIGEDGKGDGQVTQPEDTPSKGQEPEKVIINADSIPNVNMSFEKS